MIASILAGARGTVVEGLTAGVEISAGILGACVRLWLDCPCRCNRRTPWQPHLGYIGRSLVLEGEALFEIQLEGGLSPTCPAGLATVTGGPDPESWTYELTMSGPSETVTQKIAGEQGVCICKYADRGETPVAGNLSD